MNIDQLLKLAHTFNVVHFPQGIEVARDDGGYVATILCKSGSKYHHGNSRNKTAEGALDDLKNHLHCKAKEYVASKARDAESAAASLADILSP